VRAADLLTTLVAFDTTSHRSNAEITDWLANQARALGFAIRALTVTDASGVEKVNLVCTAGPNPGPGPGGRGLALVGHTDCVPFDSSWKEALKLTEKEGRLFARGASDTKGFIAAALAAVESLDLGRLTRPLSMVFTHDEEVGCLGAKRLAAEHAVSASYAIIGEPTSLQPIRANKGYCIAEVEIVGREGHSAYPEVGVNAIFHAARLISRIEGIALALKSEADATFVPPYTTVNVGRIEGGKAKNIIPGSCKFVVEWRPIPGQNPEAVYERLAESAEALHREDPRFECELTLSRADQGAQTAPDSALVKHLEEATGKPSGTVPFGTEAAQMAELGAEPVVCGPGDIRHAHRTGEFVPVEELERAVEIYAGAVRRFCIQDA
jgi:acetylornithine deacetylase